MGDTSKIEWTDATWNPVTGCTKVSPGCDHCYAEGMFNRFNGPGAFDTVKHHSERLHLPYRWRKPRRVFVNSMSDLFHDAIDERFIAQVFAVMAANERHTFQVLTKRHARMLSLLTSPRWAELLVGTGRWPADLDPERPVDNVWLGVSVENQQWADIRIPALLATPAAVRFLSCEPLLGPVDLTDALTVPLYNGGEVIRRLNRYPLADPYIAWVIVGGESGPSARPMQAEWVRTIRDRCAENWPTAFFFKQWGSHDEHGKRMSKHDAGRLLDGRTYDEYPVTGGSGVSVA